MAKKNSKKTAPQTSSAAQEADVKESIRLHILSLAFICVAVFFAYSNSLSGTWALDDSSIGQYRGIEQSLNLKLGYRKVTHLSFAFNKWINPQDVLNYRLVNIVIHCLNVMLVYWLTVKTLRLPGLKESFGRFGYSAALLAGTIFALHPLNINAVAYVVQRMASLATMFVLLSVISYIYARTSASRLSGIVLYAVAGVLIFLGIFAKENAVMALPLILLYDYFFIAGYEGGIPLKKIASGAAAAAAALIVAAYVLNFGVSLRAMLNVFLSPTTPIPASGWTAVDVYWTPLQHILTEFRVLARYFMLLLLPLPNLLVFDYWGFEPSISLVQPSSTILALAAIAGLLAAAGILRKKAPFISFGILWYMVAISLESFVAVGSDFYFEHRNYLPLTGFLLGLSVHGSSLLGDNVRKTGRIWIAAGLLGLVLGGLTFQRNFVWKDSVVLWSDTVQKAPANLRAVIAVGNAYMRAANIPSSAVYYEKAMEAAVAAKRPQLFYDAAYSLGMARLFMGQLPEAKKVIDLMEARLDENPATTILKGYYSSMSGNTEEAVKQLNESLATASELEAVSIYTLIGDTYRKAGQPDKALESYRQAVTRDPSFSAAYFGMGGAYFMLKDIGNAETNTGKALAIDPGNPLALSQMADILLIRKAPVEKALEYAKKAVSTSPVFYQPYVTMGTVLIVMGKEDEGEGYFLKAAEHGLRGYLLQFNKARAYLMKGDKKKAAQYLREIMEMNDAPQGLRESIRKGIDRL